MKLKSYSFIFIAGMVWFAVGVLLILKGINFHWMGLQNIHFTMFDYLGIQLSFGILFLICVCFGLLKAWLVLKKAATRNLAYYLSFSTAEPIFRLYQRKDLILIFSMILLGRLMRWLSLPFLLQGMILETVGCALFFGSFYYFRVVYRRMQPIQ